jgi:hypothetical protein
MLIGELFFTTPRLRLSLSGQTVAKGFALNFFGIIASRFSGVSPAQTSDEWDA